MTTLPEDVAKLVDWLPKKRYMELYGETAAAIDNRISRKYWTLGVEYTRPPGAGVWISIRAVNAWAAKSCPAQASQMPSQ